MNTKTVRQREILKVVSEGPVATQGELRDRLKGRGFAVDQATLSRDIRELGLVKVSEEAGGYRYSPAEEVSPVTQAKSRAALTRAIREMETSGNLIVIKTEAGGASPLGIAIDRMHWGEVAGTVAGDDTLLVIVREGIPAKRVTKRIENLQ